MYGTGTRSCKEYRAVPLGNHKQRHRTGRSACTSNKTMKLSYKYGEIICSQQTASGRYHNKNRSILKICTIVTGSVVESDPELLQDPDP
jgi:hypothetical protein